MAKRIILKWVEVRYLEVPDKCPTASYKEMMMWLNEKSLSAHLLTRKAKEPEIVEITQDQEG